MSADRPRYSVVTSPKPARRGEAFVMRGDVFILKVYREVPNALQFAETLARKLQEAEDRKYAGEKIIAYNRCPKCGLVGITDAQFTREMPLAAPCVCPTCLGPAELDENYVPGYDGVTPMKPYAGVVCPQHGDVDITEEEYEKQLDRPNQRWRCPLCGEESHFNDERFEQLAGM